MLQTDRQTDRQGNYDVLRVLCCIAVITLHVESFPISVVNSKLLEAVMNGMSRFAVPCFVMLSGAFLLSDSRNAAYRPFYRKSFKKLLIPILVFTVFYFLYSEGTLLITALSKGEGYERLLVPVKSLAAGSPFFHMWYVYTILGVYILVPPIVRLKEDIGERAFCVVSWIMLALSCVSGLTSTSLLNWSIGKVSCFLGYLMAGCQLKRIVPQKSALSGVICLCAGFALLVVQTGIIYADVYDAEALTSMFNPLITAAALLIFAGFSRIRIRENALLLRLSKASFLIYLSHAFIIDFSKRIVDFFHIRITWGPAPVVEVFLVLGIAWLFAELYQCVWNRLDRDGRISDRLCRRVGL